MSKRPGVYLEKKIPGGNYARIRILMGDLSADMFVNDELERPIFLWTIQRNGSSEIIRSGDGATFGDARLKARRELTRIAASITKPKTSKAGPAARSG